GRDLDLDPLVARFEFDGNLLEQRIRALLQANRNAAAYFSPRAADVLPKRFVPHPRFKVPDRSFNPAFGHAVPANAGKRVVHFTRALNLSGGKQRGNKLSTSQPGCVDRLVIVEG